MVEQTAVVHVQPRFHVIESGEDDVQGVEELVIEEILGNGMSLSTITTNKVQTTGLARRTSDSADTFVSYATIFSSGFMASTALAAVTDFGLLMSVFLRPPHGSAHTRAPEYQQRYSHIAISTVVGIK